MEKDTGGAAFPKAGLDPWNQAKSVHCGMTLRDYFAAHAPVTIDDAVHALQCVGNNDPTGGEIFLMMSAMRFGYADAMIETRNA